MIVDIAEIIKTSCFTIDIKLIMYEWNNYLHNYNRIYFWLITSKYFIKIIQYVQKKVLIAIES